MDDVTISRALKEARTLVEELENYDKTDAQQHALLKRCDKVRSVMEGPYEMGTRWLENMSCAAALNLLLRINAFERIPSERSITAQDLAALCKVDVSVITRAMRVLVVSGVFRETGRDEYAHNELSRAFHPTALGALSVCVWTLWVPGLPHPNISARMSRMSCTTFAKVPLHLRPAWKARHTMRCWTWTLSGGICGT